ncbi:hypothetical protein BC827DRAFT_1178537 [Russula dissimulans]|nr:hypothetical protein BC827DRAFT_1178537 [Russula dissimulans]
MWKYRYYFFFLVSAGSALVCSTLSSRASHAHTRIFVRSGRVVRTWIHRLVTRQSQYPTDGCRACGPRRDFNTVWRCPTGFPWRWRI